MSIIAAHTLLAQSRLLNLRGYSCYSPIEVESIPPEALEGVSIYLDDAEALSLAEEGWLVISPQQAMEIDRYIALALGVPGVRTRLSRPSPMVSPRPGISRVRIAVYASQLAMTFAFLALFATGTFPIGR